MLLKFATFTRWKNLMEFQEMYLDEELSHRNIQMESLVETVPNNAK